MNSGKKCSACGFNNDPFADECAKCQLPLGVSHNVPLMDENSGEPSLVCPSCRFENELVARMCIMCGADLPEPESSTLSSSSEARPKSSFMQSSLPKLCAVCNWKNDYSAEVCSNCGTKLPRFLSTSDREPVRKSPWPALVFWFVFLSLVGAGIYLAITTIIIPASLVSRQIKVQNAMKNFNLLAKEFSGDHSGQYWENGKYPFGDAKIRFDYKFRYFGDDADDNDLHSSGMFVFIGTPVNIGKGDKAYAIDESGTLLVATLNSQAMLDHISMIGYDDINWDTPCGTTSPSRCDYKGVEFKLLQKEIDFDK